MLMPKPCSGDFKDNLLQIPQDFGQLRWVKALSQNSGEAKGQKCSYIESSHGSETNKIVL